jgi:uncharacterized membrane protein
MTGLRRLSVLATGLALAALPAVAMAQAGQGYYDGHMWGGGGHGWFFVPLMMVFWLVVLVGAVVLIVRWLGASALAGGVGSHRASAQSPRHRCDRHPQGAIRQGRDRKGRIRGAPRVARKMNDVI